MGKQWKQCQTLFFFFGSKITVDGDCSHEIKRRLLLGRKVMTNLDSIFKSRDLTLPTKVHLVKAMVFPVVMYRGDQSIGVSASASVLPMNIQGWFLVGLTSLISLLFRGLSEVFSNTTVQKRQFFGPQLAFWSNSHIHIWLLEKP